MTPDYRPYSQNNLGGWLLRIAQAALYVLLLAPCAALAQTPAAAPAMPPAGPPRPAPLPVEIVRIDPALDKLIAPDAQFTVLADGFGANEGPMWKGGKLWVSEQRNNQISTVDLHGTKTIIVPGAGGPLDPALRINQGPNGLVPYRNGAVLVCRQGLRDIGLLNKYGTFSPFVSEYQGKHLNSPNDLVIGPDGALWFSDPPFSVPGGRGVDNPDRQLPFAAVFRFKDGVLTPVATDNDLPNGLGFSPDGKTLYVSSDGPGMYVRAYDVGANGTLSNSRIFYQWDADPTGQLRGLPDGLKIDMDGNLWVSSVGGVNIITPQGKSLGRLQVASRASNVAFGGPEYKDVFITGGDVVYHVRSLVRGEIPAYADE
jgi:gluconolactonase